MRSTTDLIKSFAPRLSLVHNELVDTLWEDLLTSIEKAFICMTDEQLENHSSIAIYYYSKLDEDITSLFYRSNSAYLDIENVNFPPVRFESQDYFIGKYDEIIPAIWKFMTRCMYDTRLSIIRDVDSFYIVFSLDYND